MQNSHQYEEMDFMKKEKKTLLTIAYRTAILEVQVFDEVLLKTRWKSQKVNDMLKLKEIRITRFFVLVFTFISWI